MHSIVAAGSGGNGGIRGGGDIFICDEGRRAYLVDTYSLRREGRRDESAFAAWEAGPALEYVTRFLERAGGRYIEVARAMRGLKLVEDADLPELDDDLISPEEIPPGCEKVQLGIQELESGELRFHPGRFALLSPADRIHFFLHEGFIRGYLLSHPGGEGTARVREAVRALAVNPEFQDLAFQLLRVTFTAMPATRRAVEAITRGDWAWIRRETRIDWLGRREDLEAMRVRLSGRAWGLLAQGHARGSTFIQPIYVIGVVDRVGGEILARVVADCLDPEQCVVVSIQMP